MTDAKELLEKASERRQELATQLSEGEFCSAQDAATELRTANVQIRDMAEALVEQAEKLDEAASECRTAAVASAEGSAERQAFSDLAYGLTCAAERARAALAKLTQEKK